MDDKIEVLECSGSGSVTNVPKSEMPNLPNLP